MLTSGSHCPFPSLLIFTWCWGSAQAGSCHTSSVDVAITLGTLLAWGGVGEVPVSNGFPGETEGMCLVSPEIQKFVLLLLVKP